MPIDWDALANKAAQQTDNEFSDELAKLTSLNTIEITNFIAESSIRNEDAVRVLQEINNAARTNNQKATAIASIDNGVSFLVSLVGKVV